MMTSTTTQQRESKKRTTHRDNTNNYKISSSPSNGEIWMLADEMNERIVRNNEVKKNSHTFI